MGLLEAIYTSDIRTEPTDAQRSVLIGIWKAFYLCLLFDIPVRPRDLQRDNLLTVDHLKWPETGVTSDWIGCVVMYIVVAKKWPPLHGLFEVLTGHLAVVT